MFNVFGISLHIFVIVLLYLLIHTILIDYKGNLRGDGGSIILSVTIGVIILIGSRLLFRTIDKAVEDDHECITILGYLYFRKLKKKWIYHSDLGYYLCIITTDKIKLYEPKYLYMKEVYDGYNSGTIEGISKNIKTHLDNRYKSLLVDIQQEKEYKERINKINKWDGYLDVQSRRDDKIDKILK
jgi:hypothetical protein